MLHLEGVARPAAEVQVGRRERTTATADQADARTDFTTPTIIFFTSVGSVFQAEITTSRSASCAILRAPESRFSRVSWQSWGRDGGSIPPASIALSQGNDGKCFF